MDNCLHFGQRRITPRATKFILNHRSEARASRRRDGHSCCQGQHHQGPTAASTSVLALKEWAVACQALKEGDQTVLFRKGGIREPTFAPAADKFYLFPTAFHVDSSLIREPFKHKYAQALQYDPKQQAALAVPCYADVTGAWRTMQAEALLPRLRGLHVWTDAFLEARLKWRGKEALTILELRVYELPEEIVIPMAEHYFGCFSWVDLAGAGVPALPVEHATAVIPDEAFAAKQALLRSQLQLLEVEPLAYALCR